jgi:SAM-dependent methyltransferase
MRDHVYKEISGLIKIKEDDLVVDYGCGNGGLCFYLYEKYRCKVIGIDYSKDAIKMAKLRMRANRNLTKKIKFYNLNNDQISKLKLKNVKAVFFCDVIEHLYDHELKTVFKYVGRWGQKVKIIVHTDNKLFLHYIAPILNLLKLVLGTTNLKDTIHLFREANRIEKEYHVNLTTPFLLRNKLAKLGLTEINLYYPRPSKKLISQQLGGLNQKSILIKTCNFFIKRLSFLTPTFYAVYEK